ncbi:MAG: helix-turn-helix transcriptional regulator [Zoogloeaceae bacterium]|nr:helix-turn-helix transcriptional regulator [Zoogloeaceae bacterium]
MSVQLSFDYRRESESCAGTPSGVANPFFRILAAVRDMGSIGRAAEALGLSYRHVWGVIQQWEETFGQPLLEALPGQAARLSDFGERLYWAERRSQARAAPQAEALAAALDHAVASARWPERPRIRFSGGYEPWLDPLRQALEVAGGPLVTIEYPGAVEGLARLNAGQCDIVGLALAIDADSPCGRGSRIQQAIGRHLRLGEHKLIRVGERMQGLLLPRSMPVGLVGLADLLRPGVRFACRPQGTANRMLMEDLWQAEGGAANDMPAEVVEEPTQAAVAMAVAAGAADGGFGTEMHALACGLGFVPLVREQIFVACRKPFLDTPQVAALRDTLATPHFQGILEGLPGHRGPGAGGVISLRRTLPWYK